MPRTIQYALHKDEMLVISRVGDEVAWPTLEFERIGQGGYGYKPGDFNGPMLSSLRKMPVMQVGREWDRLRWTRKIPYQIKNEHRKFWGMDLLTVETILDKRLLIQPAGPWSVYFNTDRWFQNPSIAEPVRVRFSDGVVYEPASMELLPHLSAEMMSDSNDWFEYDDDPNVVEAAKA